MRNLQVDVPPGAVEQAVAFWAGALGGEPRETDGTYVHVDGVRSPVGVHLQRLRDGRGGYHLDLEPVDDTADVDVEVERLVALGAEDLGPVGDGEPGERVLRDPAGLRFCVAVPGQTQHLSTSRDPSDLRILVLDVPPARRDAEVAFWAAVLGAEHGRAQQFPMFSWVAGSHGPAGGDVTLLVQALGGDDPSPGLHVDLHVPDEAARDAEVERLARLGAVRVAAHASWVVMRTPGGPQLCVVPDGTS